MKSLANGSELKLMKQFILTIDNSLEGNKSKFTLIKFGANTFNIFHTSTSTLECLSQIITVKSNIFQELTDIIRATDLSMKKDVMVKFSRNIKKRFVLKNEKKLLDKIGHTYYNDRVFYNDISKFVRDHIYYNVRSEKIVREIPEVVKESVIKYDIPEKKVNIVTEKRPGSLIVRDIHDTGLVSYDKK